MAVKTLSVKQLFKKFPTEDEAVEWFEKYRWNGVITCPKCNQSDKVRDDKRKYYYRCFGCQRRFSVRMGTVMESSRIPVKDWLYAMYSVLTSRKGISSLQLSKELGITQKSVWFMYHRIREACKQHDHMLEFVVEVDETYIGGKELNKHKNKRKYNKAGCGGKVPVVGIKQRNGRVRLQSMKTTKENMINFIRANIKQGTSVFTDKSTLYKHIEGFDWSKVDHSAGEYARGEVSTNNIESVWALLKRAYKGTFHNISKKHLQRYIDEFAFRLNEGSCDIDTTDRIKSLTVAMGGKRLTYKKLIK